MAEPKFRGRPWATLLCGTILAVALVAARADSTPDVVPRDFAQADPVAEGTGERVDYLTFAAGALPVSVSGAAVDIGTSFEHAIEAIDGDPNGTVYNLQFSNADTDAVFVYELPALTTFDRLAVPEVTETPSPSRTFFREILVEGSATGPDGGFERLAAATLVAHDGRGQVTELAVERSMAVRWVRLRLAGPIEEGATFLEFSEIIGNGTQEPVARVDGFTGVWDPRLGLIELHQEGAVVTGCADDGRKTVTGTVTGNLLRAVLDDNTTGVMSAMIVAVDGSGGLWGLRSDNGAPFRLYTGGPAPAGTTTPCSAVVEPSLGCGAIIHGITFAYDSAELLPDAEPVLAALHAGLSADPAAHVAIVGHTSSEGSEAYNQDLSERRAQSVVADLTGRGLDAGRLSGEGRGESQPIADNDNEAGRSLNRRVEVVCH